MVGANSEANIASRMEEGGEFDPKRPIYETRERGERGDNSSTLKILN